MRQPKTLTLAALLATSLTNAAQSQSPDRCYDVLTPDVFSVSSLDDLRTSIRSFRTASEDEVSREYDKNSNNIDAGAFIEGMWFEGKYTKDDILEIHRHSVKNYASYDRSWSSKKNFLQKFVSKTNNAKVDAWLECMRLTRAAATKQSLDANGRPSISFEEGSDGTANVTVWWERSHIHDEPPVPSGAVRFVNMTELADQGSTLHDQLEDWAKSDALELEAITEVRIKDRLRSGLVSVNIHGSRPFRGKFKTEPASIDFRASRTDIEEGNAVSFTNTTKGLFDRVEWDFGDGNASSKENPTHRYQEPGVYDVTLSVPGLGERKREDYVNVSASPDILGITAKWTTASGHVGWDLVTRTNPAKDIRIIPSQNKDGKYRIGSRITAFKQNRASDPMTWPVTGKRSRVNVGVLQPSSHPNNPAHNNSLLEYKTYLYYIHLQYESNGKARSHRRVYQFDPNNGDVIGDWPPSHLKRLPHWESSASGD